MSFRPTGAEGPEPFGVAIIGAALARFLLPDPITSRSAGWPFSVVGSDF